METKEYILLGMALLAITIVFVGLFIPNKEFMEAPQEFVGESKGEIPPYWTPKEGQDKG